MDRFLIAGTSEVVVGRDIIGDFDLPDRPERRTAAILAQPAVARVARSVARRLASGGIRAEVRVIADGEAAKSLDAVAGIYEWLNDIGMTRHDTVVGVGGGAATDAVGFVAATYLRGVEAVYVPTTLLGAVDASIGGKTGINVGGKNLVGVFAHPRRVIIDVALLESLPIDVLREGAAEALKAGLIGDVALVELFERDGLDADLGEVVRRSVAVKAGVVDRDYREGGERAHLNYGHTVGHAVEVAAPMAHGHAVAVGMIAAGRVSSLLTGFAGEERQRAIIGALGLPTTAETVESGDAHRLIALDKKRDSSGVRFVVLHDIARPAVMTVDAATLDAALAAVGIGSI